MYKLFLAFAMIVSFSLVFSEPSGTDDFSYSATLTDAKTSLRQIDLPLDLYEKMQRKDYGDLRVFSANGQIVPHQFLYHQDRIDSLQETPLVFYPFSKEQSKSPSNIRIVVSQNVGGQSLRIDQHLVANASSNSNEHQYIIENKKNKPSLCKLKLDWKQSKPSSILNFRLESSDQLQNWRTLSRKLTVSKLNYAGSQLKHDQINFPCTSQKYLRLTWLQPEQQAQLIQIKGIYTQKGVKKSQWSELGKARYNKENKSLLFNLNVVAPISKLEFLIPQDGLLYKGKLFSRDDVKSVWKYRKEVSQYRLNMGDTTLESSPVILTPSSDRYWKISLKTEGGLTESQLPKIRAGWMPTQLYFLAQGNGPFKIAFGNPSIKPVQKNTLDGLIEGLKQSGTSIDIVSLGDIVSSNKSFEAESEIPWKLILLWLVLIIGTALMGFMAYRLFQQMSDDKNTENKNN